MTLQNISIEDLEKELVRRRSMQVGEIRKKIDEHKKAIRDLEDQIRAAEGTTASARRTRTSLPRIPQGERATRVLGALEGTPGISPAEIAEKVGFDGIALRATLTSLVEEGKITRFGKARGTKYRLS